MSLEYTTREILVYPENGEVSWGDGAMFPHPLFGWKSANLRQTTIGAEDALGVAEANGGQAYRESIENTCQTFVGLSGDRGWYITYVGKGGSLGLALQIDPYSGKISSSAP